MQRAFQQTSPILGWKNVTDTHVYSYCQDDTYYKQNVDLCSNPVMVCIFIKKGFFVYVKKPTHAVWKFLRMTPLFVW